MAGNPMLSQPTMILPRWNLLEIFTMATFGVVVELLGKVNKPQGSLENKQGKRNIRNGYCIGMLNELNRMSIVFFPILKAYKA